ncbi:uncharacterized protein VTP21DRAFT_5353 [Calcarisporiella thermophila]|uniref:uncharacterized protein n=1 Tax=Calcarisporiella thermophila TaxID=911321 RepID=UPI0037441AAE
MSSHNHNQSPPKDPNIPSNNASNKNRLSRYGRLPTFEEVRKRRLSADAALRKMQREQLITAKRFRHTRETMALGEDDDSEFFLTAGEVEQLKNNMQSPSQETRMEAMRQLTKYLVDPPDTLKEFVINGECVDILTKYLKGMDPEEQLQATWCITNIAAGSPELSTKALSTVPYLITLLQGENNGLQDQAAWAIGNMAVEGDEFRDVLRANGVLIPLINLLKSTDLQLVQTACFALSNLARGANPRLDDFFDAGISELLFQHLAKDEAGEVISEVSWVLTYLTCKNEQNILRLIREGLVPLLVKCMPRMVDRGALAIPLIRTLGNIASGPDEFDDELLKEPQFLPLLLKYIQSECRSVKKESLWVMSNITAARRAETLSKVIDAGFVPVLSSIVAHTNFDLRKEAAFSLVNIASHGPEHVQLLPHNDLLPVFLDFVRGGDPEMIQLGLTYIQLLLTHVPEGKQLIESIQGIEALESLSVMEDPQLRHVAGGLMDMYFGEQVEDTEVA